MSHLKRKYRERGFHAVTDAPRSGRPRSVTDERVAEVVQLTLETAPKGATHRSTRGLAKKTGLSQSTVSRIWQAVAHQPRSEASTSTARDTTPRRRGSRRGAVCTRWGELGCQKAEPLAVGPATLEHPGEVGLDVDVDLLSGATPRRRFPPPQPASGV
ncbi:MAG: helix-turn-helix domain-containing protein [Myxococcota bacterium]